MKNFWIAAVLLLLAVIGTVCNALAVKNELRALRETALSPNAVQTAQQLEQAEPYLALTVNHVILEQAQTAALEMAVYAEPGNADFLAARARFLAALTEIEEGEKFSISNIF